MHAHVPASRGAASTRRARRRAFFFFLVLLAASFARVRASASVGTHCLTNANDLAPCQTAPGGTACCTAIGEWNDAGCFCSGGVTTALDSTQATYAAQFATICGITTTTSASDATCTAALAAQSSSPTSSSSGGVSPSPVSTAPAAPTNVYSLRTGTDEVIVGWTASTSSSVVAYAIDACDASNLATCASPTRVTVAATATSHTFTGVSNPTTMVYRIKAATVSESSDSTAPTSVPMRDARAALIVSNSNSASSTSSCGSWATPCDSIASALVATTSASTRSVLVLPGTHGSSSCGSTLGSSAVSISSVLGSPATTLDCAEADRGFDIAGAADISITGLTITNGLASTGGGIRMTNAPSVTLEDVVVSGCKSQTMGGGLHLVNSQPVIKHSRFVGNSGGNDRSGNHNRGGGAYLQTTSHATLLNVSFVENTLDVSGKGGGLNVDENSNVTANGLTLTGNKAFFAAGLFIGHGCHGIFSNILATENEASYGAAIGVFEGGNPTFNTGLVKSNKASLWGAGVIVYTGANAHFEAMAFEFNEAEIGGGVLLYSQSTASMSNSRVLSNVVTKYGGGIRLNDRATLSITNTRVSNNVAVLGGGGVHVTSGATLSATAGEMVNNTAPDGGAMYCSGGEHGGGAIVGSGISVKSNIASGLGGGAYMTEACAVEIKDSSTFESNSAVSGTSCRSLYDVGGGAFALEPNTAEHPTTLVIDSSSTVKANVAPSGGAFFVVPAPVSADANSPKGAQITLDVSTSVLNNTASGCQSSVAGRGGAMYLAAGNHTFSGVTFESNTASTDGGAIFVESVASVTMQACTASQNTAETFGGAVAHVGAKLKISTGTFTSNTASGGGAVYVAKSLTTTPMFAIIGATMDSNTAHRGGAMYFAANLALGTLSNVALHHNTAVAGADSYWIRAASPTAEFACASCAYAHANGSIRGVFATEALSVSSAIGMPASVESGKVTDDFSVQLVDFYSQAVTSEIVPVTCAISPVVTPSALARHSLEISGAAASPTSSGVAVFTGAILRGELGEAYVAKITCTRDASANLGTIASLDLAVRVGTCLPGSEPLVVRHADGVDVARECTVCKDRTFNFDGIKCKTCPNGGDCRGGTSLDALPGWWRSSETAELLFSCPIRESCAAGNATGTHACEEGYEGPVCALCAPGYRHWGGKCSECGSNAALAVPLIGILAFLAFLVYIFRKPLKQAVGTVIFSACMFVAQILGLLKEYDIAWPKSIGRLVEVLDITNFNMESLTPGCSGSKSNYYSTYITAVVVPPAVTAFCIGIYLIMGIIERNAPMARLRVIATDARSKCRRNATWLVVLSYSGVAKTVLQLYNQRHLDVGVYLRRDYSIITTANEHFIYRITGFIALLLYPIGIPVIITAILVRNRNRLDDPNVEANFGFLYTTVRKELPFWELTGLFLKFVLAATPVFANERVLRMHSTGFDTASDFNGVTQLSLAQFFVGVIFIATLCIQPYKKALHNVQFSLAIGIVFAMITLSANVFNAVDTYTEAEKTAVAAVSVASAAVALFIAGLISLKRGEFSRAHEDQAFTTKIIAANDDTLVDVDAEPRRNRSTLSNLA